MRYVPPIAPPVPPPLAKPAARWCFAKVGTYQRQSSPCSNADGFAVVWREDGLGACGAHSERLYEAPAV